MPKTSVLTLSMAACLLVPALGAAQEAKTAPKVAAEQPAAEAAKPESAEKPTEGAETKAAEEEASAEAEETTEVQAEAEEAEAEEAEADVEEATESEAEAAEEAQETEESAEESDEAVEEDTEAAEEETAADEDSDNEASDAAEESAEQGPQSYKHLQKRIDLGVGAKISWVSDAAYDLVSEDDVLSAVAIRLGTGILKVGKFSTALVAEYDYGATGTMVRSQASNLDVHTVEAGAELRYHFIPRLAVQARVLAGINYVQSTLGEGTSRMKMDELAFAGAVTAGATVMVLGSTDGEERGPRAHLYLEGGYGFSPDVQMSYTLVEAPERTEDVDLGPMSLAGPQLGVGVILSF